MRDVDGCLGCASLLAIGVLGCAVYGFKLYWERGLTDPDPAVVAAETEAIAIDACADVTRPLVQRIDDLEARRLSRDSRGARSRARVERR